jgi:hypothetical protein
MNNNIVALVRFKFKLLRLSKDIRVLTFYFSSSCKIEAIFFLYETNEKI